MHLHGSLKISREYIYTYPWLTSCEIHIRTMCLSLSLLEEAPRVYRWLLRDFLRGSLAATRIWCCSRIYPFRIFVESPFGEIYDGFFRSIQINFFITVNFLNYCLFGEIHDRFFRSIQIDCFLRLKYSYDYLSLLVHDYRLFNALWIQSKYVENNSILFSFQYTTEVWLYSHTSLILYRHFQTSFINGQISNTTIDANCAKVLLKFVYAFIWQENKKISRNSRRLRQL